MQCVQLTVFQVLVFLLCIISRFRYPEPSWIILTKMLICWWIGKKNLHVFIHCLYVVDTVIFTENINIKTWLMFVHVKYREWFSTLRIRRSRDWCVYAFVSSLLFWPLTNCNKGRLRLRKIRSLCLTAQTWELCGRSWDYDWQQEVDDINPKAAEGFFLYQRRLPFYR